jgi:hypothetical protein
MGKCSEGDCNTGKSIFSFPNGSFLEGTFKKGKIVEGPGSFNKCGDKFVGILSDTTSKGVHTYQDGSTYEGTINNAKKEGYGILKDNYGVYVGNWKTNKRHGKGVQTLKDVNKVYEGTWKDDIKEGKFTIKDLETKTERAVTYINGKDDEQRERERLSAIEYKRKEQAELAQTLRWQSMVISCNILSSGNYNHCDLSVPTIIYNYSKTAYITTCINRKNIKVEDVYFKYQLKGQKLGAIINNLARIYFDQNGNCSTEIGDLCD